MSVYIFEGSFFGNLYCGFLFSRGKRKGAPGTNEFYNESHPGFDNTILCRKQFGFQEKDSTEHVIMQLPHQINCSIQENHSTEHVITQLVNQINCSFLEKHSTNQIY